MTDRMLLEAVERVCASVANEYEAASANLASDLAEAAANKSHLADGYWKSLHTARLRLDTARALRDALEEINHDR